MGIFNELFFEEQIPDYSNIQYNTIDFNDYTSFYKMGYSGLILAEAGWINASGYLDNHCILQEANIKEILNNFISKIKGMIKHIWEVISSVINKFLAFIEDAATNDKVSYNKEDVMKKLNEYNKASNKPFVFSGAILKDSDKGISYVDEKIRIIAMASDAFFTKAKQMEKGYDWAEAMFDPYVEVKFNKDFEDIINDSIILHSREAVMQKVFGDAKRISNVDIKDVVSADIAVVYKDSKVDEGLVSKCISSCESGYKTATSNAKKMYKETKQIIDAQMKYINNAEKAYMIGIKSIERAQKIETWKKNPDNEKIKNLDEYKKSYDFWKRLFHNIGKCISTSGGLLSQMVGGYCQIVKDDWKTSKQLLDSILSLKSEEKKDEESTKGDKNQKLLTGPEAKVEKMKDLEVDKNGNYINNQKES